MKNTAARNNALNTTGRGAHVFLQPRGPQVSSNVVSIKKYKKSIQYNYPFRNGGNHGKRNKII